MNRVLESLRRFQVAQAAAVRRACDALDVPETGLNALRVLISEDHAGGVTLKELSSTIGISPAVATGLIDRLEAKGWAHRATDPADRRALRVVATIPEDSAVRRVIAALDEPLRRVANAISTDEAAIVRRLASAMEDTLDDFRPEGADRRATASA